MHFVMISGAARTQSKSNTAKILAAFGAGFNQCHLLNENSDIMSEFFFSTSNPNFLIIT